LLNEVPALEDLTCELARKGRTNIAEAKLRFFNDHASNPTLKTAKLPCSTNRGTSLARRSSILNRNLDSEPIMYLVYYMWADMVNGRRLSRQSGVKLAWRHSGRLQAIVRLRSRRLTSGWVQSPAVRAARSVGPNGGIKLP
jgi:hypothetical protein